VIPSESVAYEPCVTEYQRIIWREVRPEYIKGILRSCKGEVRFILASYQFTHTERKERESHSAHESRRESVLSSLVVL